MQREPDARLFGNRDDCVQEVREVVPELLVRVWPLVLVGDEL